MRILFTVGAALAMAGCASNKDTRFRVGEDAHSFVVIGVAEAADEREPAYTMLWRRVGADGRFLDYGGRRVLEARTNSNETLRLENLPGEFVMAEVEPGTYALDSVFAVLREEGLNYFAQGLVLGPERPSFEVRPGEAAYLGIWEMDVGEIYASARLWRLDETDMRAVARAADATIGEMHLLETRESAVPCEPHQLNNMSQRQVC